MTKAEEELFNVMIKENIDPFTLYDLMDYFTFKTIECVKNGDKGYTEEYARQLRDFSRRAGAIEEKKKTNEYHRLSDFFFTLGEVLRLETDEDYKKAWAWFFRKSIIGGGKNVRRKRTK